MGYLTELQLGCIPVNWDAALFSWSTHALHWNTNCISVKTTPNQHRPEMRSTILLTYIQLTNCLPNAKQMVIWRNSRNFLVNYLQNMSKQCGTSRFGRTEYVMRMYGGYLYWTFVVIYPPYYALRLRLETNVTVHDLVCWATSIPKLQHGH